MTQGYGLFVNQTLPPLIQAARYPAKPKGKYEQWAGEICEACVDGLYAHHRLNDDIRAVALKVMRNLDERAQRRRQGTRPFAKPEEQAAVARLSELIAECEKDRGDTGPAITEQRHKRLCAEEAPSSHSASAQGYQRFGAARVMSEGLAHAVASNDAWRGGCDPFAALGVLVDAAAAQAATQAEEPTTQAEAPTTQAVAPTTQAACDHAPADKAVDAPADEAVVASADKSGEPPPADEGEDAKTSASQTAPNSQAAPMAQAAGDGAPAERIDAPAPPQGR